MIVNRVELKDFRIYKGHNVIDLSPQPGKNIYIVSGKNGFGKTTFLMSLVWCLYGRQMDEVDDLYKKEIADQGGYYKYIANSLNRQARAEDKNIFSVKLAITDAIIPDLTCNEISIQRTFNVHTMTETLAILIDGFENELIKELGDDKNKGEENFIRDYLLPIEIAKFFFFDAEKIVNLAEVNTQEQRRKLSKAYSEILGIKKYEDAKIEIEETQLRIRARTANAKERKLLNTLESEINNAKIAIGENNSQIITLKDDQVELKYLSDQLQSKLVRAGSVITLEELEALRSQGEVQEKKLREIQQELAQSYDVIPFAIAGNKLNQTVLQINSEVDFREAKFKQDNVQEVTDRIITDLISEQKKIPEVINRKVQDFYFDTISKLIKKHFFADTPEFPADFKVLHDFSDSEKTELQSLLNHLRTSFQEQFKRLNYEYNQARNELLHIRRRINEAEADAENEIAKIDRQKKEELDDRIQKLDRSIIELEVANNTLGNAIAQKEKQREELRKKLTATEQDQEKDKLTEELSKRLKEYITLYKSRKKKSLEDKILEGLRKLMHKQNFIDKVEVLIMGEDIEIRLYNKRGDVIPTESLSKGEQQLYATALLYGMVEESDIDFPVFIDSPMQKFDEEHAKNIVRFFYPSIADQVILFPLINKEITQQEYHFLQSKVAQSYLIVNHTADHSAFEAIAPGELFERYNTLYNN